MLCDICKKRFSTINKGSNLGAIEWNCCKWCSNNFSEEYSFLINYCYMRNISMYENVKNPFLKRIIKDSLKMVNITTKQFNKDLKQKIKRLSV